MVDLTINLSRRSGRKALYFTLRFSAKGSKLRLQMNVDGLPLLKSLNIQHWPRFELRSYFWALYFGGPRKPESSFWMETLLRNSGICGGKFGLGCWGDHFWWWTQRHYSEIFHEQHNGTQRIVFSVGRHVEGAEWPLFGRMSPVYEQVLWAAAEEHHHEGHWAFEIRNCENCKELFY